MKKKIILPIIAVIVLAGGLALASPLVARLIVKGGINYMNKKEEQEKEELVKIAESKEMKETIEELLKELDSQALTPQGKIKSYRINKNSVTQHPMGGMMFDLIINNDENLILDIDVERDASTNKLTISGNGRTPKLSKLLNEE